MIAVELRRAAALLEAHGWAPPPEPPTDGRGRVPGTTVPERSDGRLCVMRALVLSTWQQTGLAALAAEKAFVVSLGGPSLQPTSFLYDWERKPGRTAAEVVGALLTAAEAFG